MKPFMSGFSVLGILAGALASIPEAAWAGPDCICLAQDKTFHQGDTICLYGKVFVCGMNQNITSWIAEGQSCPVARLDVPLHSRKPVPRSL
jgi:hypothetical protein